MNDRLNLGERVVHDWLRRIEVAFVPGPVTPLLETALRGLSEAFVREGHVVVPAPADSTDVLITTATFGEPLSWREAIIFSAPRKYGLARLPTVYTLLQATRSQFEALLSRVASGLRAADSESDGGAMHDPLLTFPGLAPSAPRVLAEQGRRGGPILAAMRVLQAQAKSIHLLLVIGEQEPDEIYHFDLVGAHPRSLGTPEEMYTDAVMRIVTSESTRPVDQHQYVEPPVPRATWRRLTTPQAMMRAAAELEARSFFTPMVRIADLVHVPAVSAAVASQYSEGCYSTWDPELGALISTVTGSLSPVNKGHLGEEDLAVLVGIREDGRGALVRPIEGLERRAPSSEAVEMWQMDISLPHVRISLGDSTYEVPVIRSKLHGHRGVSAYDASRVEYVPLDAPYFNYLVSCGSDAQARGISAAFARSQALRNPEDPRQLVFTVLPGHGVVIVEKWVAGAVPFQRIWEEMDSGHLVVDPLVPQGPFEYVPGEGNMRLLGAG